MPSAAEQSVMRLYALTNFMASIGLGSACGYDVPGNAITELSVFWIDSLLLVPVAITWLLLVVKRVQD
jgi:hypothetical protein